MAGRPGGSTFTTALVIPGGKVPQIATDVILMIGLAGFPSSAFHLVTVV